jgi:peptide/nickel transport system permease protein
MAEQAVAVAAARSARPGPSPWLGFLARRLLSLVLVLLALVIASFLLVRIIPGDPALNVVGPGASAADVARVRAELGLDRPAPQQFVTYVGNLATGNLGSSYLTREPVAKLIGERIGASIQLAGVSLAVVLLLSIPLGLVTAAFTREGRHRKGEVSFTAATSVAGSIPEFLAATFLAFVFAVWLRLLPVAGSTGWESLLLPVAAIAIRPVAILSRLVRVETLNVLAQDYIRTARSKQLPERVIYLRHVLPNVLTATLTIGGLLFANLIGGAVVVENVFQRLGLGTALVSAILSRDYAVTQVGILVLGVVVVVVNAVVDLLLAVLDPRSLAAQS